MADAGNPDSEPVRARKVPREDVRPESLIERQTSLGGYLIHRAQRRRERFLERSRRSTIGHELLRAGYLTGCILLDFLVIPEPIFLISGQVGWVLAILAFVVAIGIEGWFYSKVFALPPEEAEEQ